MVFHLPFLRLLLLSLEMSVFFLLPLGNVTLFDDPNRRCSTLSIKPGEAAEPNPESIESLAELTDLLGELNF